MEKPYILVESRFSESIELMVADSMANGYSIAGGVSTTFNGENVWYTQAMVFTGKPKVEFVSDDPMAKVFSPVIFKLLKDNKITTLESLTRLSPRQLMLKSPHFTHQVIARIQASLLEVGLRLPFEL